jgi:hypothetical protein
MVLTLYWSINHAANVQAPALLSERAPTEQISAPRITPANTSNRRLKSIKRSITVIVRVSLTLTCLCGAQHVSYT